MPVRTNKVAIAILLLVLAALAVAIRMSLGRPTISLTLVEYNRVLHGATVRLANGSPSTIRFLAERNHTPSGNPIFRVQKTSSGWTGTTLPVQSTMARTSTGKTVELFYLAPTAKPKAGDRLDALSCHELKPGRKADFFILLQADAPPIRVGTIVIYPPSKFTIWLSRVKQWCRIKQKPPGQMEIWCPTPLCLPPSDMPSQ